METKQINLKIPINLLDAAQNYVENFGFRNIQDLATESIREKIFEKNKFDENFNEEEIEIIDNLIEKIIKNKDFSTEEELNKILLE
ncbi:hypothetical protein KAI04_02660 [Candidatus Pacearchaeota archaeon]|nr:hypothetical protein [Candidatus Pacearchaeota archaeon]